MLLTGAQILIEELVRNNVDTIFGYPGGAVLDIYDELYKNEARLRHVISAHEQGAAHAADGYARVTGKAGVVIATSGPGAANLVTGIANAYLDSVPLVVITGNVATALLGKDSFQEVDIVGITQPIVKHNHIVRDVKDLASELASAFQVALSGRRGPVLIDIPKDVQKAKCEYKSCETAQNDSRIMGSIKEAIDAINKCKKPYIYSGGGVIAAKAEKEVLALSQKISAPIGLSMMGLTAIPHSYQLNLGMCGMHGKYAASVAQSKSDLMIAVGVRFSDRATGDIAEYTKNCRVIHIDIDHAELGKNVPNIIELCGDAKQILSAILEKIEGKHNNEWIETIVNDLKVDVGGQTKFVDDNSFSPKNIIHTIREYSNDDTIIATDVGQHQMWVMQNYAFA
ncbi:MAG: thiamine pyrophosphate-binding protein, partial [Treponema sp.]|nr:thiamine pyrophosphate-binding protein [Treponema sp.]